jgi:hypothetical protein
LGTLTLLNTDGVVIDAVQMGEVLKLLLREFFLTAEEAVANGFIGHVLQTVGDLKSINWKNRAHS